MEASQAVAQKLYSQPEGGAVVEGEPVEGDEDIVEAEIVDEGDER